MATKNNPKGQHYYPKFNLEYFTDQDGWVWVFDSYKNEYRNHRPEETAKINNFYTFETKEGKRLLAVEELLSILENEAAPIIAKIHNGGFNLDDKEKSAIAFYIALQQTRTPMHRQQVNKMIEQVSRKMLQVGASNKEYFQRTLDEVTKNHPEEQKVSVEEMQKFIFEDGYKLEVPKEMSMQIMVGNLNEFANLFFNMGWLYLVAPSKGSFLTSDVPITMRQTDPDMKMFGQPAVGYQVPGTEITLPLTPQVCLYLTPKGADFQNYTLSRDWVRVINTRTTQNCFRYVFSSSKPLLENLIARTKLWEYRPIKELVENS